MARFLHPFLFVRISDLPINEESKPRGDVGKRDMRDKPRKIQGKQNNKTRYNVEKGFTSESYAYHYDHNERQA